MALSRTFHAPGLAPAWMEGHAYGFISSSAFKKFGKKLSASRLLVTVTGEQTSKIKIKKSIYELKKYIEKSGYNVIQLEIPEPGKHPHYDQMATLLFLMESFGLLGILLSSILVANMISAILEHQKREIGIM